MQQCLLAQLPGGTPLLQLDAYGIRSLFPHGVRCYVEGSLLPDIHFEGRHDIECEHQAVAERGHRDLTREPSWGPSPDTTGRSEACPTAASLQAPAPCQIPPGADLSLAILTASDDLPLIFGWRSTGVDGSDHIAVESASCGHQQERPTLQVMRAPDA